MTPLHSTNTPRNPDHVAEYDLTLEKPGRWILEGNRIARLWYGRQRDAMSYAEFYAGTSGGMLVRLHNEWEAR